MMRAARAVDDGDTAAYGERRAAGKRDGGSAASPFRSWIARPKVLARLIGWTAASLAAGLSLRLPQASTRLEAAAERSALVERAHVFFSLHDPLGSWWFAALVAATLLSLLAWAAERVSRPERGPRRRDDCALVLLAAGGLILLSSLVAHGRLGVAGEVLLEPSVAEDHARMPAPMGEEGLRPMGLELTATAIDDGEALLLVSKSGEELRLREGEREKVLGARLELRETRPAPRGDAFVLSVMDRESGETVAVTAERGQAFQPFEDLPSSFVVISHLRDHLGLGAAVRVKPMPDDGPGGGPAPLFAEPFWLFVEHPEFDLERGGRLVLTLKDVAERREAIVAVVRPTGMCPMMAGGLLVAAGLALALGGRGLGRRPKRPKALLEGDR